MIRLFLPAGQTIWCLLANFENFGKMVSSVHGGKIVWCLLSTLAKLSGVFCPGWQKGVVSFVHPGKKCLVSFGSGVFCLAPKMTFTDLFRRKCHLLPLYSHFAWICLYNTFSFC